MPDHATPHPAGPRTATASSGGGIDMQTLLITAASSAAAAYTCSQLWAPGTLAAAAFTPVLVAIIKEALAKSTQVVTRAVPVRGVVRSSTPQAQTQQFDPVESATSGEADPGERVAQPGEIAYHGTGRRARNWRVAIVTGLLGFVVAAVVFTVPELVAGGSASGGGRGTTIFGGKQRERPEPAVTTTTTTPTQTVTTPPAETVTVPVPTVTEPTTTPVPTTTTPATPPATTTTVPPPQDPVVPEPPAAPPPG